MYCPNCGAGLPAGSTFCGNCGTELGAGPRYGLSHNIYCKSCGLEVEDGRSFCSNCGAEVFRDPRKKPVRKKKKKSNKGLLMIAGIAAAVAVIAIGIVIFGGGDKAQTSGNEGNRLQKETEADPEYVEVFENLGIEETQAVFSMQSVSYAAETADGMVEKLEFGCEDDVIRELVDTFYYPISDYDAGGKAAFEEYIRSQFAGYEALDFATVAYASDSGILTVTLRLTDLDQEENIRDLAALGFLTTDPGAQQLSMEQIGSGLTASGYIRK